MLGHGTPDTRLFFRFTLPVLATANLVLGIVLLAQPASESWEDLVVRFTGGFCFMVSGWLFAAGWSTAYWSRAIQHYVRHWAQLAEVIFGWLEEAPVPLESLRKLRGSLEDISE